jgi:very-short-patch-repair endonuclease
VARLDAAYPALRIGIEADGYEWHSSPPDWLRDRRRQNALVSREWTILRFCREDAARPAPFVADLRRVYEARVKKSF